MFVRLLSEADAVAHRELRIMSINESPQLSCPQIVRELAIYQRIGTGALMAHASGDTRGWGAFDGGMRLAGVVAVTQEAGMHPRSEEHTSELQSLMRISYAVFCL